ncbi:MULTISPECIES: SIMPL domain-containing protein [Glaesserella]|uniref:SIMPL domain-containing protein n=1 Tax=Glaesserella australis TaxID=2094024 RepID=A0A328C104_9PAST|nr:MULTISPECIES: SIMPL domain-containing protein [Glaesserella]AUI67093.1 hypothetical protein CJD39_11205 [Glaesserella sp. 15-184]RAL18164.1 hypothetical protein C5N92_09815 [Glaesserella australis]
MKLKNYLAILPLALVTLGVSAETENNSLATKTENGSVFHFSTQVTRSVDKDLMHADVYSRKSGKNLAELKKTVSNDLNKVLTLAKQDSSIEVSADGISNYAEYDNKGKVIGWVAEGHIQLKGKNFDAIANVLENLGDNVAINAVRFSVSPEKASALEDEMTLEIIQQFQHKAEVIQKGLKANKYILSDIRLETPNSANDGYTSPRMYAMEAASVSMKSANELPLEAGKQTINASASGKVRFE